jgi:iron complex transport system ATP-binding protein
VSAIVEVEDLACAYDGREALRDVDCSLEAGERVAVLGPNGSGKTTLLRALCGTLRPRRGSVRFEGKPLRSIGTRELARALAVVPAETAVPFAYTVQEFVSIGRMPHLGWFGRASPRDRRSVERALEVTDTVSLAEREVRSLSSGERARVVLAQALAQGPRLLLLDEPTNGLHRAEGLTWLAVLHDPNLAAEYASRLLVLREGSLVEDGPPEKALRGDLVREVFGEALVVDRNPATGAPNVRFAPRAVARPDVVG